ncbi:uncharacterized protein RB166_021549 [Leptodactylus fuscus]|uniref:uncharacterized protein LOC142194515 n=1 Tax=Leptodactylus fuscus TaxID=238119 RepID=UPI003F4EF3DB
MVTRPALLQPPSDSAQPTVIPTVGTLQGLPSKGGDGGLPIPTLPMGHGAPELRRLLKKALAASTWAGHKKSWKEWLSFSSPDRAMDTEGCRVLTYEYVARLAAAGVSAATTTRHLSGMAFGLKLLGLLDVTKEFPLKLVLEGLKKARRKKDHRHPVSFLLLGHLWLPQWFGSSDTPMFSGPQNESVQPMGLQLGFRDIQVRWLGVKWEQVLLEVVNASRATQAPVVLVIHAGGNNMVSILRPELITRI